MSTQLASIDLSAVTVGTTGSYNWQAQGIPSNTITPLGEAAHLRLVNASSLTLRLFLVASARGFDLAPGGTQTIELSSADTTFSWLVTYQQQGGSSTNTVYISYYEVGEELDNPALLVQPNPLAQQRTLAVPIAPGQNGSGRGGTAVIGGLVKMSQGFIFQSPGSQQFVGQVVSIYLHNLSIFSISAAAITWSEWSFNAVLQDGSGNDLVTPVELCCCVLGAIGSPGYNYPNSPWSPWFNFTVPNAPTVMGAIEARLLAQAAAGTSSIAYSFSFSVDPQNGTTVPSVGSVYAGFAAGKTF